MRASVFVFICLTLLQSLPAEEKPCQKRKRNEDEEELEKEEEKQKSRQPKKRKREEDDQEEQQTTKLKKHKQKDEELEEVQDEEENEKDQNDEEEQKSRKTKKYKQFKKPQLDEKEEKKVEDFVLEFLEDSKMCTRTYDMFMNAIPRSLRIKHEVTNKMLPLNLLTYRQFDSMICCFLKHVEENSTHFLPSQTSNKNKELAENEVELTKQVRFIRKHRKIMYLHEQREDLRALCSSYLVPNWDVTAVYEKNKETRKELDPIFHHLYPIELSEESEENYLTRVCFYIDLCGKKTQDVIDLFEEYVEGFVEIQKEKMQNRTMKIKEERNNLVKNQYYLYRSHFDWYGDRPEYIKLPTDLDWIVEVKRNECNIIKYNISAVCEPVDEDELIIENFPLIKRDSPSTWSKKWSLGQTDRKSKLSITVHTKRTNFLFYPLSKQAEKDCRVHYPIQHPYFHFSFEMYSDKDLFLPYFQPRYDLSTFLTLQFPNVLISIILHYLYGPFTGNFELRVLSKTVCEALKVPYPQRMIPDHLLDLF